MRTLDCKIGKINIRATSNKNIEITNRLLTRLMAELKDEYGYSTVKKAGNNHAIFVNDEEKNYLTISDKFIDLVESTNLSEEYIESKLLKIIDQLSLLDEDIKNNLMFEIKIEFLYYCQETELDNHITNFCKIINDSIFQDEVFLLKGIQLIMGYKDDNYLCEINLYKNGYKVILDLSNVKYDIIRTKIREIKEMQEEKISNFLRNININ